MLSLISSVVDLFTSSIKNKKDLIDAANQKRKEMILSKKENCSDFEIESLKNGGKSLRFIVFLLFASPIFIAIFSPATSGKIINALHVVPTWWEEIFVGICLSIFGVRPATNFSSSIFSKLQRKKQK